MPFFPLYIDPGTGSALFSIAVGIAAAGYFLFRGIIIKLGVAVFRKNEKSILKNKYVIYAEDKRYWLYFKAILLEFEKRQTEILYLTQSIDDPVFACDFSFIKGRYIGQGNKAFAYLNFLSADFVLSTTPDLDVLQWKRSKNVKHYSHILHAAGGVVLYRLFGLDYYDSIILSADYEIPEIRFLEKLRNLPEKQLIVAGNTFFDICGENIKTIAAEENHPFTVLISPTWGPSGLLSVFGEKLINPLAETGWRIIIRPHPQSLSREILLLDKLTEKYRNNPNIIWDYSNENIYTLSKSDIMISDYSGIIYDYIFLFNRPVLINISKIDLRLYDAWRLEHEPYYLQHLKESALEINADNLDNIREVITQLIDNKELENKRKEIKGLMWHYQGESAKRIADYMIKTVSKSEIKELC